MVHTIRQSRGYSLEYKIVKKFNEKRNWFARRLGGSTSDIPDIIATNNELSTIIVMEAKAGTGKRLVVPQDQIEKCFDILKMFSIYNRQIIMFPFKFMLKTKEKGNEVRRQLKEYYYFYPHSQIAWPYCACNYHGRIFDGLTYKTAKDEEEEMNTRRTISATNLDELIDFLSK